MAFFDDFSRKISKAGQSAIQKTKEMTDIAKINSAISNEERKLHNNYYQLGKLYAAKHTSDYEADFASAIAEIKEAEQKLASYQQQIQNIKGVVRCASCGAEVEDRMAFCSSCGAALPKKESAIAENSMRCENCGALLKNGMRFCTSCGKSIETAAQTISEAETTEVQKVCPNCRAEIEDHATFCTNCGNKL